MALETEQGVEQVTLSGETPRARIVGNEARAIVALALALYGPVSAQTLSTHINRAQGLERDRPTPGERGVRQFHGQIARQLHDFDEGDLAVADGLAYSYTSKEMKIGAVITALELLTISCSEKIGNESIKLQDISSKPPASRIGLNMVDVLSETPSISVGQLAKMAHSRPDKVAKIISDWKRNNIVTQTDSGEIHVDANFSIAASIARATSITIEDIQRDPDILQRWAHVLVPGFKVNSSASTERQILGVAKEFFKRRQTITALLEKRPHIQEIKPEDILLELLSGSLTSEQIHTRLLANAQQNGDGAEISDVFSIQVNHIAPLVQAGIITGHVTNNGNERLWSLSPQIQQKIAQVRQYVEQNTASTEAILQQLQQDQFWQVYPQFGRAVIEQIREIEEQKALESLQQDPVLQAKILLYAYKTNGYISLQDLQTKLREMLPTSIAHPERVVQRLIESGVLMELPREGKSPVFLLDAAVRVEIEQLQRNLAAAKLNRNIQLKEFMSYIAQIDTFDARVAQQLIGESLKRIRETRQEAISAFLKVSGLYDDERASLALRHLKEREIPQEYRKVAEIMTQLMALEFNAADVEQTKLFKADPIHSDPPPRYLLKEARPTLAGAVRDTAWKKLSEYAASINPLMGKRIAIFGEIIARGRGTMANDTEFYLANARYFGDLTDLEQTAQDIFLTLLLNHYWKEMHTEQSQRRSQYMQRVTLAEITTMILNEKLDWML